MNDHLTVEQTELIKDALLSGNKIKAIKLHREFTGLGLKESKDFVENLILDLIEREPEKYSRLSSLMGSGCRSAAIFLVGLTTMLLALFIGSL